MKITHDKHDSTFGRLVKAEHEKLPITGLKPDGYPFKDYTQHVTDWDMDGIDEELCLMFAKHPLNKYPKVVGSQPPELKQNEFEDHIIYDLSEDMSSFDRDLYDGMDSNEIRKYFHFRHKTTLPWFFIIDLKPSMFNDKHIDNTPWSDIAKMQTPYTKHCIEKLPFKEIGRVVIYGSWSNSIVPCHRDSLPTEDCDQIINFNPGGYRPVYVYDSLRSKKVHLNKDWKAYSYNTTDYHGVDSVPHFSYTVRVDGSF